MRVGRPDGGIAHDGCFAKETPATEQPPNVTLPTVKRSLPIRLAPLPGEALESWLAALAVRMGATWGELLDAVLPTGVDGLAATHRAGVLTTGLTDTERQSISKATGVDGAALDSMTLAGIHGAPLITTDPRTLRARTPWGVVYRQRYCPLCVKSCRGRRKLEWFLPWTFVCLEHRCLLADTCPQCCQRQTLFNWFARRLYPHPEQCSRLIGDAGPHYRCSTRLSKARPDKLREGHLLLASQVRLAELLAEPTISAGVYEWAPVSPEQLLIDLHVLGNWIMRTPHLPALVELFDGRATEHRIEQWDRRLNTPPRREHVDDKSSGTARAERVNLAATAPCVAAGVAAALGVLMQPTLEQAGHVLRAVMPAAVSRELRYRPRKSGIVHSEVITAVDLMARAVRFTVLQQLRYRTITDLPRLPDTRRHAATNLMLNAVPTLFWPEWAFRLDTEDTGWNTARQVMSRLLLAIGCTMADHRLHRLLRTTVGIQRLGEAADVLSCHRYWVPIVTALLRLQEYLQANPPPIDYQRRRELSYTTLLPEAQWAQLTAGEGFSAAPTATTARLWLTEQLSGAPVTGAGGQPRLRKDRGDNFRTTLTPELLASLERVCVEYLRGHGISDEPLSWSPPLSLLDDLSLPGTAPDVVEPQVIHELLATGLDIRSVACKLEVSVSKIRYQLERHPMPCGDGSGSAIHRMKWHSNFKMYQRIRLLLPEPALRDLYDRQLLTFPEIARQLNIPGNIQYQAEAVSKVAHEYGIQVRGGPRK